MKEEIQKYGMAFILLVLMYVAFLVIKPFINPLITSAILAYLFYPFYKRLIKKVKPGVSAFLVTALAIIIIIVPLGIVAEVILKEAISIYNTDLAGEIQNTLAKITSAYPQLTEIINTAIKEGTSIFAEQAKQIVITVPSKIINTFIIFFSMFYFLIHGEQMVKKTFKVLPFDHKERVLEEIGEATGTIVFGLLILAVIEFIIGAIGFWVLGIKAPVILGLIVGILAFIPMAGPGLVWGTIAIFSFAEGKIGITIGLILLGVVLFGLETVGKAKLIGQKTKTHPIAI
ncbi:AI-2E family transporter, partial [Candidatus Woesearchaeota archaeon]|nr:AI-2E family transporter [Candidatus Woesearchaeota archaeon]